jgi:hypothetical protein
MAATRSVAHSRMSIPCSWHLVTGGLTSSPAKTGAAGSGAASQQLGRTQFGADPSLCQPFKSYCAAQFGVNPS